MSEHAPKRSRVKASLNRLAGNGERDVIERAAVATEDIDAAAAFVEAIGVDQLELAIKTTDDVELESKGQRALAEFEDFRRVARDGSEFGDHFHPGHGTDLRGEGVGRFR